MKHYLIIVNNQNCMGTNKEALIKWAKMIKPSVRLIECPLPKNSRFYQCILIKEAEAKASSFSANTYKELMEKIEDEAILCNN